MLKKISNIFLVVLFIVFFIFLNSIYVNVSALFDDSFRYEIIDNEAIITRCYNIFETIPDTIEGYPVTKIGEKSFCSASYDKSLLIPDTVKEIGDYAFFCEIGDGIRDITIPKSVTRIGKMAIGYQMDRSNHNNYYQMNNVVIRGYLKTAAQSYAGMNGIKFIALDEQPEVTTTATTQISTTTSTTVSTSLTTTSTQSSTSTSTTTTTSATTSSATSTSITTSTTISSQTTPVTSTTATTSTTSTDITVNIVGDANNDGKLNIVDAAFIAQRVAQHKTDLLPECADYNKDGFCDIRDAAAIARDVARRKI